MWECNYCHSLLPFHRDTCIFCGVGKFTDNSRTLRFYDPRERSKRDEEKPERISPYVTHSPITNDELES